MEVSISVYPQNMVGWDESAWESFVQRIGTMTVDPDHSWQFLMSVNKNFRSLSPECQKKALVAVDRLILVIREDMEQIMAAMQDVYQDAYTAGQME